MLARAFAIVFAGSLLWGCGSTSPPSTEPTDKALASSSAAPTASADAPPPVEWCKNADECARGCDAEHAQSCGRLGEMLRSGGGVERDLAKARMALERGCDLGGGDACFVLTRMRAETGRSGAEVAATAMRACDAGSGAGCLFLERMLRFGLDVPHDIARADALAKQAIPLLSRSCDAGDVLACTHLSSLVWEGTGTPADPSLGAKLQKHAADLEQARCAERDVLACGSQAGRDMMPTLGVAWTSPAATKARATFRSACDIGDARSCAMLSLMLQVSDAEAPEVGPLRDKSCRLGDADACVGGPEVARGLKIWRRDCDNGDAAACANLAARLEKGPADPSDIEALRARARALLVAACRVGAGNCFTAASMLEKGVGGPADPAMALQMLDVPCRSTGVCTGLAKRLVTNEDPDARARGLALYESACARAVHDCDELAELYEQGKAIKKNAKRAKELRAKIAKSYAEDCERGEAHACSLLADLHATGLGVPKDAKKAKALAAQACALGLTMSCDD